MAEGALADLKVLDLSQQVSGPYCTRLLAGYGAEVIKIEPPGKGDPARRTGPFYHDAPHPEGSCLFLYLNTRKKSITLDLETKAGARIFKEMVKKADVVVESFRPNYLAGLGLGWEALREINPSLVLTSITYFGQDGPYSNFKGSNIQGFAVGGQMMATGEADRPPLKNGSNQADYQGGLNGFSATVAVAYSAKMTGLGQHVDVSAMECQAAVLEGSMAGALYRGVFGQRAGRFLGGRALMGIYPCRDGYFGVHAMPRNWPQAAAVIGMPELLQDPRFVDTPGRLEHNDELKAIFYAWAAEQSKMDVYRRAGQMRGPFAPVLTTKELLESPQLKEREYFVEIDHPCTGRAAYPGTPFKMTESPWQAERAPLLGEHNEEVYGGWLGFSKQDLVCLRQQGVI